MVLPQPANAVAAARSPAATRARRGKLRRRNGDVMCRFNPRTGWQRLRATRPLTLQRKIAARSTNCVEAVGPHYGRNVEINGLGGDLEPRSTQKGVIPRCTRRLLERSPPVSPERTG